MKGGPKGAVVLEDRRRFNVSSVDHVYRVRIFAEEGRGAAEIEDLPSTAEGIQGRTVYPDGREVQFNNRKDMAERTIESGNADLRRTHLIAPGITTDCVMELRWSEPTGGIGTGLPNRYSRGRFAHWTLLGTYPIQTLIIEIKHPFPLGWVFYPGSGFETNSEESSGYKRITLKNLPALENPPYSLLPLLHAPYLAMFYQEIDFGHKEGSGADSYWKECAEIVYKREYEKTFKKGAAYSAFSKQLTAGLPSSPAKCASELLVRLESRVANLSHLTFAEAAALPKTFWDDFVVKDFDAVAKTGKSNSRGMRLLFFHLLRDAGIHPKIALVPDRDISFFEWRELNYWQFGQELIGVDEPGVGMVWFDPTLRYATPGVVLPKYRGVPALIINSKTWEPEKGIISGRSPILNVLRYRYALNLGDEADGFTVESDFGGYPEYLERSHCMYLEPLQQSRMLKDRFENSLKNLSIEYAEFKSAIDPRNNVSWRLKGVQEPEIGRTRLVVPFPGMPWPLWVPSKLDEVRTAPIVLPYLLTQIGISTFNIPKGYVVAHHPGIMQQNSFGSVQWVLSVDETTGQGKVQFKVEVTTISAGADRWNEFRAFLSWIDEACRQKVVLSK